MIFSIMSQISPLALFLLLCMQRIFRIFYNLSSQVYNKLERTIPGFNAIMEKVQADAAARDARRKERREAQKKAEDGAIYGGTENDP